MIQVRPAASGLTLGEAVDKAVTLATREELISYLKEHYSFWEPTDDNVTISYYGYDSRVNWRTYIICVGGRAALFSNGSFKLEAESNEI